MAKFEIKIEDNIAIPERIRGGRSAPKYPFAQMAVGQSFVAPAGLNNSVALSARANKLHPGLRFTARKTAEGVRIWRVK